MLLLGSILCLALYFLVLLCEHLGVELSAKTLILGCFGSVVLILLAAVGASGRHSSLGILSGFLKMLLVTVRSLALICRRLLLRAVLPISVLVGHGGLGSLVHGHPEGCPFRLVDG